RSRRWQRAKTPEVLGHDNAPTSHDACTNRETALDLLEARAQFDGPERVVHTRVAEHAGRICLDLADERWRAVDIGPGRIPSYPDRSTGGTRTAAPFAAASINSMLD